MKTKIPILITFLLISISTAYAQTYVSGTITGETWIKAKSPYMVTGDVMVASLTVEPGVQIRFTDNFKFEIAGKINANGTQSDPIIFTGDSTGLMWNGLLLQNTVPGSELNWCIIEQADNSGIRIIDSYPSINNCTIRNNTSLNSGAGLYIVLTSQDILKINNCQIENNQNLTNYKIPASNGGGIYVSATRDAKVRFMNCSITDNYVYRSDGHVAGGGGWISGQVEFAGCVIRDNTVYGSDGIPGGSSAGRGGGLYISDGNILISNTKISGNLARGSAGGGMSGNAGYASGGGIHFNAGLLNIYNTIISHNTASGTHGTNGAGIYAVDGVTYIENSTLAYNNIHAIENINADISVMNAILYFNNADKEQVKDSVAITFSDVQNGYDGEGNINYNPVFYNDTTLIIVDGSPCIDMGNPDPAYNDLHFPPSLGEARNDMGAHGGPGAVGWLTPNDKTDILHFSFGTPPQTGNTIIDFSAHTINLEVVYGTDVTSLVAAFDLSDGATASVNDILQESGTTANDFTGSVTYLVTAEDGINQQEWMVTVTIATGIRNEWKNDFSVYPNPFSSHVILEFSKTNGLPYRASVYNLSGVRVCEFIDIRSGRIELPLSNLSPGTYIIKIAGQGEYFRKFLIKQ
ncbi:MAG: T9SS type A sorting domain-containing protein [Bacteroidales bacterium]|nr:T9SS type A sorting domain-containing protein [Bacteroidales bacterium]MBN2698890.1 T9SS type A sorting domain-containing protein [Bacteroidales bacterium]